MLSMANYAPMREISHHVITYPHRLPYLLRQNSACLPPSPDIVSKLIRILLAIIVQVFHVCNRAKVEEPSVESADFAVERNALIVGRATAVTLLVMIVLQRLSQNISIASSSQFADAAKH